MFIFSWIMFKLVWFYVHYYSITVYRGGQLHKNLTISVLTIFSAITILAVMFSSTVSAEAVNIQTSSKSFTADADNTYIQKLVDFKYGPTWAEMTYEVKNPYVARSFAITPSNLDFFIYRWIGNAVEISPISYEISDFVHQNFTFPTYDYCSFYNTTINSTTYRVRNISDCNPSTITEERIVKRILSPDKNPLIAQGQAVNVTARISWKYKLGETVSMDLVPCVYDSNWFCQTKYAWFNTSFNHRIQVNFSEQMGQNRTPEAVYYHLVHNNSNTADCSGIDVTNASDTGPMMFNATKIDNNTCDIWFLSNITANYNGTVGYIYWGNRTIMTPRSSKLSELVLFNETCDDGNLYDGSGGYNWTRSPIDSNPNSNIVCLSKTIRNYYDTYAIEIILDGGLFWNNISFGVDVSDYYNVDDHGPFVYFLSNQTNTVTKRAFGIDTYFTNELRYTNWTNGADHVYDYSTWNHGAEVHRWTFTKGEDGTGSIKFYMDDTYRDGWNNDVAQIDSGTIALMTYNSGLFDNITVIPNLYYRNINAVITATQEDVDAMQPPVLLSPANNSILGTLPEFNWTESVGVSSYTLEISTDPTFAFLNYSKTTSTTYDNNVTLISNQINKYYWRVTAYNESAYVTSSVMTFNYSQWNITFNVTGSDQGNPTLIGVTISNCTYGLFNQNGDTTNPYGPYQFPNGTWTCIFSKVTYFDKTQSFDADSNKIVNVVMSEIGGITFEEHTWLEAIYNCVILKSCDLYNLLLDINQTAGYTWNQVKPTDWSVVVYEQFLSSTLNATHNISIEYHVMVPEKAGYAPGTWLPIRMGFWFQSGAGECHDQGTLPSGVEKIEPYCNPLMIQTLGAMGSSFNFTVVLRPNLTYGTYDVNRIIEIDPDNVWTNYGQEKIGTITVEESNLSPESIVYTFKPQAQAQDQNQTEKTETAQPITNVYNYYANPVTANAVSIPIELAGAILVIIVLLGAGVIYFYKKKKK